MASGEYQFFFLQGVDLCFSYSIFNRPLVVSCQFQIYRKGELTYINDNYGPVAKKKSYLLLTGGGMEGGGGERRVC